MQRLQPPCNCVARTAQTIHRFPDFSSRASPDPLYMSLDEVLSIGTALVEHWELLHGCSVTDTHLDSRMLHAMIDAVVQTLMMYEVAVGSAFGGWGEAREPNGLTKNPQSTPSNTSRSISAEPKPALVVTKAPAYLGTMQLDSHEMAIVAREALRHATMRLGEMLHDIEEDMSVMRDQAKPSAQRGNEDVKEVRQTMSRLLRLMGRINSNESTMNEE